MRTNCFSRHYEQKAKQSSNLPRQETGIRFLRLQLAMLTANLFLLSSCLPHAPKFSEIHPPEHTRTGLKIIEKASDLSHVKWWEKMHDPVLNQLIEEALRSNNQIKTAKANMIQAKAQLKAAHFAWLPTLDGSATGFIGETFDAHISPHGILARNPLFTQLGNIHFRGYNSGFVPSYSLNLLKNIESDKLAKASLDLQLASYQSARLSTISQISGAYFMLLGQKEQQRLELQLIRDLKKNRQLEWVRYHKGGSDLSTIAQIDKQIANQQANLTSIENSISQLENAIQILLNHNPGPILTHSNIHQLSVKGMIPAHLSSCVLKNRPDVIMAESNLRIALANLGIAYSQFFPTFSLTSSIGGVGIDLSRLLTLNAGLLLAQAAATWPLFNGVAYEKIHATKAGAYSAYFTYVQTLRTVFANVDDNLRNQQLKNKAYVYQHRALKSAQQSYRLASVRYRNGARDQRELLNAQLTIDYARLDLNTAKMQQLDSIVQVYQALGGGFTTAICTCL